MKLADQLFSAADEVEQNLSKRAYETVLEMILKRELPVNTVLQERRLADMMNISRTPVRNALNRLENEGFIARNGGRTPSVKEFSIQELVETLHIRRILETEATRLAAGKIPLGELDEMEQQVRALLLKKVPDTEADWEADSRIHETIARYSGNRMLVNFIRTLRLKTHMFHLTQVPERFEAGHKEHLAIIAALRDNLPELAQSLIAAHIDNVREGIIRRLSQF